MKTLIHHILLLSLLMLLAPEVLAASVGRHAFATTSALASGYWVKIKLDGKEDGIYQITYDQLAQMGFNDPDRVGIYGFGGHPLPEAIGKIAEDDLPEVATLHDDANRRILFYGRGLVRWTFDKNLGYYHKRNTSDEAAYYFLHQKDAPARTMEVIADNKQQSSKTITVDTYDDYQLHEDEQINIGRSGREKFGESFLNINTQRFTFEGSYEGDVRLTVNFVAKGASPSSLDITLDDGAKQTCTIGKTTSDYAFATETTFDQLLPTAALEELSVGLTYHHPTGSNASLARLNYIKLQGQRAFALPGTYTLFRSSQASTQWLRFDLRTAIGEGLQVWDVTSASDVKRQETTDGLFTPSELGLHQYALVNVKGKGFPGVSKAATLSNQNLHGLPMTDMVIITAPAYLAQAEKLADYRRRHDGLHVTVLTPEPIYNEFSSGSQDITPSACL